MFGVWWFMTHEFKIVPVGIENKASVVIFVIVTANARLPIVGATC